MEAICYGGKSYFVFQLSFVDAYSLGMKDETFVNSSSTGCTIALLIKIYSSKYYVVF